MTNEETTEQWKVIDGWGGKYAVSNRGRVMNTNTGKVLKAGRSQGYDMVGLCHHGHTSTRGVHRLVALCFIPLVEGKTEVNHIDCIRNNNSVENLEWCTRQENIRYGVKCGNVRGHGHTPLAMFDANHTLVAKFESFADAQRKTGIKAGSIWPHINEPRKRSANQLLHGYKFEYLAKKGVKK